MAEKGTNAYEVQKKRIMAKSEVIGWMARLKGCAITGDTDGKIDWHHIDISKKGFKLSGGTSRGWKMLFEEIEKCIPLRHDIHSQVHAALRGERTGKQHPNLAKFMWEHYKMRPIEKRIEKVIMVYG